MFMVNWDTHIEYGVDPAASWHVLCKAANGLANASSADGRPVQNPNVERGCCFLEGSRQATGLSAVRGVAGVVQWQAVGLVPPEKGSYPSSVSGVVGSSRACFAAEVDNGCGQEISREVLLRQRRPLNRNRARADCLDVLLEVHVRAFITLVSK